MEMNVVYGVLRAVVPSIVAYAIGKGLLPADTSAPEITAAVVTLVAAGWSVVSNWRWS